MISIWLHLRWSCVWCYNFNWSRKGIYIVAITQSFLLVQQALYQMAHHSLQRVLAPYIFSHYHAFYTLPTQLTLSLRIPRWWLPTLGSNRMPSSTQLDMSLQFPIADGNDVMNAMSYFTNILTCNHRVL